MMRLTRKTVRFGAVLGTGANTLHILACACHGVAAGHERDRQHGRDDFQAHDRLLGGASTRRLHSTLNPLADLCGVTRTTSG